eukprot:7389571-Prymnesium_polylepis.1
MKVPVEPVVVMALETWLETSAAVARLAVSMRAVTVSEPPLMVSRMSSAVTPLPHAAARLAR